MSILSSIALRKQAEVAALRAQHSLASVQPQPLDPPVDLAQAVDRAQAQGRRFLIAEFKRRSPSAGVINDSTPRAAQVAQYLAGGAHAISVLTDGHGFGGSYHDLQATAEQLHGTEVLLLQKDFVLDEIQIALARRAGAHLILLIAAMLPADALRRLNAYAKQLGMGVLIELKDLSDLKKIEGLAAPVVGVNHRDLDSFRIALCRSSHLRRHLPPHTRIIAESGIAAPTDVQLLGPTPSGLLVGTGLMRTPELIQALHAPERRYLLKACGIRSAEDLARADADFVGLNFSPHSRRRVPEAILDGGVPMHAVGVFYGQPLHEIMATLERYRLARVQVYAPDLSVADVAALPAQVLLALRSDTPDLVATAEAYAPHVDAFIIDGPEPGSGRPGQIPIDFPFPFLLAGGITAENVQRVQQYPMCVGADSASGIETQGAVDLARVAQLRQRLRACDALPAISTHQ